MGAGRKSFPPHSCGGLIEARRPRAGLARFSRFPPHSCGGLIEARAPQGAEDERAGVFPRIRAGASLKRRAAAAASAGTGAFSPAFVRGPH